jgi:hypothetical protein
MADVDLNFLARQMDRLISDVANIRDDITVLTAMGTRLEGAVHALTVEVRAGQRQFARLNDRVRKLELADEAEPS